MIIADDSDALGEVSAEYSAGFILEAHLEAFLAGNWKSINWGRLLRICEGPDGKSGHQFVTPIGRLDFLCIDQVTDALVVVELKRGRPSDMVIGQIARYMGYVRSHLAMPGQAVEGLIVSHEADDALRYAVAAFPVLAVMTYEVTFELSPVD
jgi:restriction system protein